MLGPFGLLGISIAWLVDLEAVAGAGGRAFSHIVVLVLLVSGYRMGICPLRLAARDGATHSPGWSLTCQCRRQQSARSWELSLRLGADEDVSVLVARAGPAKKSQESPGGAGRVRVNALPWPEPGTVPALKMLLRQKGLPVSGRKADLEERLAAAEAAGSELVPERPRLTEVRARGDALTGSKDVVQGVPPVGRARP